MISHRGCNNRRDDFLRALDGSWKERCEENENNPARQNGDPVGRCAVHRAVRHFSCTIAGERKRRRSPEPRQRKPQHYLVGYEDGTVRPQKAITRAEVATIFFRLLTEDGRDRYLTTENDFSDVAADAWYNTPVSTLAGAGMLSGYEDGSFRPDAAITRAEFAAMALRFLEEDGLVTDEWRGSFTDVGDAWYTEAVETAEIHAIVSGYPDGSFRPEKAITRAEVCAVINRMLDRSFDVDGCLVVGEMITWTDNQPDAWYYNDIQEATNDHAYDWTIVDGEIVEVWTEIL